MTPVFAALLIACGVGVWRSALGSRRLRALGATLMAWGATHVARADQPKLTIEPERELSHAG